MVDHKCILHAGWKERRLTIADGKQEAQMFTMVPGLTGWDAVLRAIALRERCDADDAARGSGAAHGT